MCARYLLRNDAAEIAKVLSAELRFPGTPPRFNVAPTDTMPVFRSEAGRPVVDGLRWGFRVPWTRAPLINTRSDKLFGSRTWRQPIEERRCVVPAEGFFEWETDPSGKLPWLITREDTELMLFAGIWQPVGDQPADPKIQTDAYSIVTCDPAGALAELHDRIPVILTQDQAGVWLDPATTADTVRALLRPLRREELSLRPVSTRVNSVRNDDAECLADRPIQTTLL